MFSFVIKTIVSGYKTFVLPNRVVILTLQRYLLLLSLKVLGYEECFVILYPENMWHQKTALFALIP